MSSYQKKILEVFFSPLLGFNAAAEDSNVPSCMLCVKFILLIRKVRSAVLRGAIERPKIFFFSN